jgi:hypothetical protein
LVYRFAHLPHQVLSVSNSDYALNGPAMDQIIQNAVASSVSVPPDQVTSITMDPAAEDATPAVTRLRGAAAARATSEEYSLVYYQVTSHDPQVSADELKARLMGASTTGRLEEALRLYAAANSVQPMTNVTVSATVVHSEENTLPAHFSSGAIAGGAMAVVVGVLLVALTYTFVGHRRRTNKVMPLIDSALNVDASLRYTEAEDYTPVLPLWGAASG